MAEPTATYSFGSADAMVGNDLAVRVERGRYGRAQTSYPEAIVEAFAIMRAAGRDVAVYASTPTGDVPIAVVTAEGRVVRI